MFLAGSPVLHRKYPDSIIPLFIFTLSPSQIFFQSPSHFSLCLSPLTSLSPPLSLFMGCETVGALWWLCILPAGRQLQLSFPSITTCHHTYALNIKSCGRLENTMLRFEFTWQVWGEFLAIWRLSSTSQCMQAGTVGETIVEKLLIFPWCKSTMGVFESTTTLAQTHTKPSRHHFVLVCTHAHTLTNAG